MKSRITFLALFFTVGATCTGQSLTGEWTYTLTTPEGDSFENLLVIQDDGIITIDMGSDGEVDVISDYTIDNDQITVLDNREDSPCYGMPGVYRFVEEGEDTVTLTVVDDECENRRQGAPKRMTKVE